MSKMLKNKKNDKIVKNVQNVKNVLKLKKMDKNYIFVFIFLCVKPSQNHCIYFSQGGFFMSYSSKKGCDLSFWCHI